MATRSTIWLQDSSGVYRGIYCHFDGDIQGVGHTLHLHYNTEEKIRALLALGALSELGEHIDAPEGHSYNSPAPGCTVAFCRDRMEPQMVLKAANKIDCIQEEYNYLWREGKWWLLGEADQTVESLL